MKGDKLLRSALWISVPYNLFGAYLFAFPDSAAGRLAQMPAPAPPAYRFLTALFVALFGGMYAYLARQAAIDRPMLAFGAIGKASAFATILALCLAGAVPWSDVVTASGDLALAAVFATWLLRNQGAFRSGACT
ncbi:MAG: hypothetical protein ISP90_02575 [Nevskia sp.]|nr:hypothetical protein [Nevskia sp.]